MHIPKHDKRFDARLDEKTFEKLEELSKQTQMGKSEIVRKLIQDATPEDLENEP